MLIIDLLRHGALEGGIKYRGRVDDPLTMEGRLAMDRVWTKLTGDVDYIITSPLRRCASPAESWAEQANIACIIEPRLAEMDYGAWEGKTIATIQKEYPGMLERWRADPTGMKPPGGESPEALRMRLSQWWNEVRVQYKGSHILVVAHSGSLRMLMALMQGKSIAYTRKIDMPYACWKRIIHDQGEVRFLDAGDL